MPVMINREGTDAVVACSCGCDESLRIKVKPFAEEDDSYVILTYASGNFYRDQEYTVWQVIRKKWKKIMCILRNKDYCYSEICMTKEDFREFKAYIAEIE